MDPVVNVAPSVTTNSPPDTVRAPGKLEVALRTFSFSEGVSDSAVKTTDPFPESLIVTAPGVAGVVVGGVVVAGLF